MLLFQKSNKKVPSRRQVSIKEVRDNILVLSHNHYRTIIETSAINFDLRSEEEQDVLIDSFQQFLQSLSCPIQIIVRTRELDVDQYLELIARGEEKEKEIVYKEQLTTYATFVRKLVSGNKILTRRFFIVVPYDTKENTEFDAIKEQLLLNQDIVIKGLERMGMRTRQLHNVELLDLFYSFYNPTKAKIQPLNIKTMQESLIKNYESII